VVAVTIKVIIGKIGRVWVRMRSATITSTSQTRQQYTPSRGTDGVDTNCTRRRGINMPITKSRQGILERLSLIVDQVVSWFPIIG
jgi:hypothetical protein